MPWQPANLYAWMMLAGILLTAWVWSRVSGRGGAGAHDRRLTIVYFAGLLGAFAGAKIAFLLAEGWHYRHDWLALASGRSVTGALLGGYVAVELAKRATGYRRATGDVFALLAPLSLALGRIGCIAGGCCPGVPCPPAWWAIADAQGATRWPAAAAELGFNAAFLAWALVATRFGWQRGNRFHVYLVAYGVFRLGHEFARANETWIGPVGGYHALALGLVVLGAWRYAQRRAQLRDDAAEVLSVTAAAARGRPRVRSSAARPRRDRRRGPASCPHAGES